MHFNLNLIVTALIPAALGYVNGPCSKGNGVCVSTSSCTRDGGTYVSGLCPNDPANIKCCNKPKCVTNTGLVGTCEFTKYCTNGKVYAGYCPGGSDFRCCVTDQIPEKPGKDTDIGTSIVNYAKQFIGNPYVYGGTSLTNGCDCSGFTQTIFGLYGIKLNRTAASQSSQGSYVNGLSNARAGDLLFYCTNSKVTHVAIYEGRNSGGTNGKIVHAANSEDGIKESIADYDTPCRIRRFF